MKASTRWFLGAPSTPICSPVDTTTLVCVIEALVSFSSDFYAYEGGPDTFGPNSVQSKKSASLDPRMIPLISNYLTIWYSYRMKLFNWFTIGASSYDTQYGTW